MKNKIIINKKDQILIASHNGGKVKETVKAKQLAHKSDLLFIRNSITGSIECRDNRNVNELNEDLHDNN